MTDFVLTPAEYAARGHAERADALLHEILDNGPAPAAAIHQVASERGIPRPALLRAAKRMDVRFNKTWKIHGGGWFWVLPQHDNATVARQFWRP